MPALLDVLRGRMKERELQAVDVIAEAARAAASGETYDIGAIEKALTLTGQTMDDFEAAVEIARKRAAWLIAFDKLNAATSKVSKLEAAAEAEKAKFEAARRAFMEKAENLDADLATARLIRDKGRDARDRLLDPQEVPGSIGEKFRKAKAEAMVADEALEAVQRQMREIMDRVKSEEQWIAQLSTTSQKEIKPDRLLAQDPIPTASSGRLEEHERALARALRRKKEAEAQLTEAERVAALASRAVASLVPEVLKA